MKKAIDSNSNLPKFQKCFGEVKISRDVHAIRNLTSYVICIVVLAGLEGDGFQAFVPSWRAGSPLLAPQKTLPVVKKSVTSVGVACCTSVSFL